MAIAIAASTAVSPARAGMEGMGRAAALQPSRFPPRTRGWKVEAARKCEPAQVPPRQRGSRGVV